MTEIVFPDHSNHLGTLFGGQALAWMDKAAFIAASRHARRTVVTARSERVDFSAPVPTGSIVELIARVVEVGRTSMQVEVELIAEATAEARKAAEQLAKDSGARIGGFRSANQGVITISDRDRGSPQTKTVRVVTTVEHFLKG